MCSTSRLPVSKSCARSGLCQRKEGVFGAGCVVPACIDLSLFFSIGRGHIGAGKPAPCSPRPPAVRPLAPEGAKDQRARRQRVGRHLEVAVKPQCPWVVTFTKDFSGEP